MYHVPVHSLAERLLGHIRREELLRAGDRVGVAVSGGIDSVALLRLLLELRGGLGLVLSVVHFNHGLRGAESDADQEFVAGLAREHGLEFYVAGGDVARQAAEDGYGVEAAARELRYGFFWELMGAAEDGSEDSGTSRAKARGRGSVDRSAGSAAPPESRPQGLKPESLEEFNGTTEILPFPNPSPAAVGALPFPNPLLTKIATGHTLDDQAETVLMRLIRGTGLRGLGGIYPRIVSSQIVSTQIERPQIEVEGEDEEAYGEIVRPLLRTRRHELEAYLVEIKQPWREDSTNADLKFTRNRVRSLVLPLLEREFNPGVVEGLAELAEIARDEEDYWENEISGWLGTVVQWSQPEWTRESEQTPVSSALVQIQGCDAVGAIENAEQTEPEKSTVVETPGGVGTGTGRQGVLRSAQDDSDLGLEESGPAVMNASVSRPWLLTEPRAVQKRVLKAIGERAGIPLEFKHVEEILRFAAEDGPSGKELSLPLGWKIVREPEAMVFVTPDLRRQERVPDYEYSLVVPGRIIVPEIEGVIEALRVVSRSINPTSIAPELPVAEYNPEQLLRADLLPEQLIVRNWRGGDRFWPAHTKAPKKVKELLQERHVAQPERRLWPVATSGDEIVWMRGFPVPARLSGKREKEAILIREVPFAGDEDGI
jgi:tRNA(Ile)-lysidine synthetase-like protein